LPAEPEDILEADEMWSFVYKRWNKRWIWTVMCRRTRQIVAFVIGDRSEVTCPAPLRCGDDIASFGNKSPKPTKVVKATATSGKRINLSFLKKHINVSEKEAGRQIIWNDGTTRSDNPVLAS
jgi:IS1 family transposase